MTENASPPNDERPELDDESDRHYLQDTEGARDEDEREQDDLLEIDQTELEELGLELDDPHQPESE
jgi:hypothetical protein